MQIITSPKNKRGRGFTLIELLVVIAIIGILAGFLIPAVNGMKKRAEKVDAENTAHNLKNSISAYNTEYRKFPVASSSGGGGDDIVETNNVLMDPLLGAEDHALNPRNIVFFSGRAARPGKNGGHRKGVVLSADGGGELWDPYSEYYKVAMDTDYNNRITKPTWDTTIDATLLPSTILVWSGGEDADENALKDNIKTW